MAKYIDFNVFTTLIENYPENDIKITSVKEADFNDMEGMNYLIGVKVFAKKGMVFKSNNKSSKLYQLYTNTTYIDYLFDNQDEYNLKDIKRELQGYIYAFA